MQYTKVVDGIRYYIARRRDHDLGQNSIYWRTIDAQHSLELTDEELSAFLAAIDTSRGN